MSSWKLTRLFYGDDEYILDEGEAVSIGRGKENVITLASAVVSRRHCIIKFLQNTAEVTDLKSANGVYIGKEKILPNKPYTVKHYDIIGIGWDTYSEVAKIDDADKYVFRIHLIGHPPESIQNEIQQDNIEQQLCLLDGTVSEKTYDANLSTNHTRLRLKRKSDVNINANSDDVLTKNNDIINISDSDNENNLVTDIATKKVKLETINESPKIQPVPISKLMNENEYMPFEAFNVKQDHWKSNDNEPIEIESDSESDCESDHWFARLSQNSPRKSLKNLSQQMGEESQLEHSSYSQMEDLGPLISLCEDEDEEYEKDIILLEPQVTSITPDEIDGVCVDPAPPQDEVPTIDITVTKKETKQLLSPQVQPPQEKSTNKSNKVKTKSSSSKSRKAKEETTFRREISKSDKEERKRKLKELAEKEKKSSESHTECSTHDSSKPKINTKMNTSRGAFLSDTVQVVKPLTAKDKQEVQSNKKRESIDNSTRNSTEKNKSFTKEKKSNKVKDNENRKDSDQTLNDSNKHSKVPVKHLKPLLNKDVLSLNDKTNVGKPINKVEPLMPEKSKKRVTFSDAGPSVRVFEIEPGNRMKKTSLVKTTLIDIKHMPKFPANKIALMKILRWNPHWLHEQTTTDDPPPILGHNKTPTSIFHSFMNHSQYIQQIGDLLLMEIWECLTVAYMKSRDMKNEMNMQVEHIPLAPSQDSMLEFANISVNMSVPSSDAKKVPRVGEIVIITFGPENAKCNRFFFVQNVRCLPSPPSNVNSFFSLVLQGAHSGKLLSLRPGEVITAKTLSYINNELMLFEAMDYLNVTPLGEIILRPEPHHFPPPRMLPISNLPWNITLNPSQQRAVNASVAAALSDRPSIQMVQGPPGTGKSSVICCMVMSYFYDAQNKRNSNRGKILICATSNAAVDALVIRLLNIRQTLPKSERFRMVRVGRAEAMHPRALPVSSQQLAHRDAARAPAHPALAHEISHLEAKLNMWRAAEQDAKDPVRVAYCQTRKNEIIKRIALVRGGAGGGAGGEREVGGDALAHAERRIVEGADIIVTTLASAHTHKTKGLKRRIALCIIDEAGQVIEPETLIPLMLDVTHITLVGDPQQLPGYICSQRAKKYGLGESLFARLTSCTELWAGSPVVLLEQQYRMHPHIVDYPNRAFYDNRILTDLPPSPDLGIPPYAVLGISSRDNAQVCGGNEWEACGVARLAAALAARVRARRLSLALVTPYHAHKDLLRKHLAALLHQGAAAVDVNTVDSFQGQERDVVVVSLARSHGVGFLADAGRINVMLTRARHALLVCLNPHAIMKNNQWRTLVEDAQQRNMYYTFPNHLCQPISPNQPLTENILKHIFVDNQEND